LTQIRLVKRLGVDVALKETRLVTEPPKCWPPLETAQAGAVGPKNPGDVRPAGDVGGGLPVTPAALAYPITEFKLVFDVQVLPPMTSEQPVHP